MITLHGVLIGMLLMAAGTVLLRYNYQIVGLTGSQDWIEDKLGAGSTYLAYKIFGLVIVMVGILEVTGLLPSVMGWLLSPLRSVFLH